MAYLFIDTTSILTIGVLDSKCQWLALKKIETKKPSETIHFLIDEMLKSLNLEIKNLLKVITCSGPGSYTGMRLSEGIVQILELAGTSACTFYHFELPSLSSKNPYFWISNAFKNEFFVYEWNESEGSSKLYSKDEFEALNFEGKTVYKLSGDEKLKKFRSTDELIVNNPEIYFPVILKRNERKNAFYYRSIEEEFKI